MKHDEMSQRTKRLLADTLKEAMRCKPFSKITVSELIQQAGINRKTFYYHFEDIYSLLKWMFEEEALEVVKEFDAAIDFEDAIAFVMDYVEANDYILNCVCDSLGREGLRRFFHQDFVGITTDFLTAAEQQHGITLEADYKAFLIEFFTDASAGMLMDWLHAHKAPDHQKITEYITRIVRAVLMEAKSAAPGGIEE